MDIHSILNFLKLLEKNNDREWFLTHKEDYEHVKEQISALTSHMLQYLKTIDSNLIHLTPKDCTYRIYRDVRFSKNKLPYKNHIGLFFAQGGKSTFGPGYYLHLQNGESFVGGGIYSPDGPRIKEIRQEIYYNVDDLLNVLNDASFKRYYNGISDYGKLKTAPRGYDVDYEHIDLLRNKSFVVSSPINVEQMSNEEIVEYSQNAFKELKPFVDFFYNINE